MESEFQVVGFQEERKHSTANLNKVFRPDQLKVLALENRSHNTRKYSAATMKDSIAMRIVVRSRGYEILRKFHNLPVPALCTINRRLAHLNFVPGSFETMLKWLHHKLRSDKVALNLGHLACLSFDEMSLTQRVEFDKGLKRYLGFISPEIARDEAEKKMKATHCLAIMVRGLTVHWKQLLTYLLTGDSIDPERLWSYMEMLVVACGRLNIPVVTVSSDMGGGNLALMSHVNVQSSRGSLVASCPHPAPSSMAEDLLFCPDVPHILKNMWCQLLKTNFILPDWYVQKHQLPGNVVSAAHVKEYMNAQGAPGIVPVPGLTMDALEPSKFQKMRVHIARKFYCPKLGHAMNVAADLKIISVYAKTTAAFILDVDRWYTIHAARSKFDGLGRDQASLEKLEHVRSFSRLMQGLCFWRVVEEEYDANSWKPIQRGVVLANEVVLTLHRRFVQTNILDYILPSRLFTSCCENLFMQVRSGGDSHPRPVRLRHMLRLVSAAQYLRCSGSSRHSYEDDDEAYYIDFLSIPAEKHSEDWAFTPEEIDEYVDIPFADLTLLARQGLYYVAGWTAFKLKERTKCATCLEAFCRDTPMDFVPHQFTNAVSQGGLSHPGNGVWNVCMVVEDLVRAKADNLLHEANVKELIIACVEKKNGSWLKPMFPGCHDGFKLAAQQFVALRVHILASDSSLDLLNPILYNSASAHARTATQNCRDPTKNEFKLPPPNLVWTDMSAKPVRKSQPKKRGPGKPKPTPKKANPPKKSAPKSTTKKKETSRRIPMKAQKTQPLKQAAAKGELQRLLLGG